MAAGNFDIQGKALIILMTCLVEYQSIRSVKAEDSNDQSEHEVQYNIAASNSFDMKTRPSPYSSPLQNASITIPQL